MTCKIPYRGHTSNSPCKLPSYSTFCYFCEVLVQSMNRKCRYIGFLVKFGAGDRTLSVCNVKKSVICMWKQSVGLCWLCTLFSQTHSLNTPVSSHCPATHVSFLGSGISFGAHYKRDMANYRANPSWGGRKKYVHFCTTFALEED